MASTITPASKILSESADLNVKAYLSVRRRFDYSALVVALYASFERFVEDILVSYIKIIANEQKYQALPPPLVNKHLKKTAELLSKSEIDQASYPGVTTLQLIENLYCCLSDKSTYELNHAAITAHDKNIRYDELGSLLKLVELSHECVRQAEPLINWYYKDQERTGPQPVSVPALVVKQRLDNLVERRNDVAHRGGNPSERLGADEMLSFVEFVSALANSIFTLFVSDYLRRRHVGANDCERLTLLKGPYKKNTFGLLRDRHPAYTSTNRHSRFLRFFWLAGGVCKISKSVGRTSIWQTPIRLSQSESSLTSLLPAARKSTSLAQRTRRSGQPLEQMGLANFHAICDEQLLALSPSEVTDCGLQGRSVPYAPLSPPKAGISLVFLGRIRTFQRVAANPNENFLVGFNSLSRLWVSASRVPLLHIPPPQDRQRSGSPSTTDKILAFIVVFEKLLPLL